MVLELFLSGIFSFLLGGIPFGYIVAKFAKNIDIRKFGSKNIGATNVGRVIGWKYGFFVLFLDACKGAIPVLIGRYLLPNYWEWDGIHIAIYMGLLSVIGHVYTPYMNFKGGKGVATGLGVCLSLIPFTTLVAVMVFFVVFKLFGYVSLGSILSSLSMPFIYYLFYFIGINTSYSLELQLLLVFLAIIIAFLHRENLVRIYQGKELKAVYSSSEKKDETG